MEQYSNLSKLLLLMTLSYSLFYLCNSHDITTDTETLLFFRTIHIKSDPQGALLRWNTTLHVCRWPGISCNRNRTRVVALDLQGLGLVGNIPPHLSNLSSLTSLNLSHNLFYGPIPPQLGHLSRLESLMLTNNSIKGNIPPNLSLCSNLRQFRLEINNLSGEIPPQLGLLTQLRVFSVSVNQITGPLPHSFGNLSTLTHLYVNRNRLSGEIPKELGLLPNLLHLQLSENQLTGEIPSSVFNISSLVLLAAANNSLAGKLPPHLGFSLPNLQEIFLGDNDLDGPIPHSLSNISGIKSLDLSSNHFVGKLPLFGRMHLLEVLNLDQNNLSSNTEDNFLVFNSLVNCTQLTRLSLSNNQLTGELPSTTANLSVHLIEFCIANNFLSGRFPEGLSRYLNLSSLALSGNRFTGLLPNLIGLLTRLQRFELDDNLFFGEIPDIYSNLNLLYQLTLSNNQFIGRIPKSIGECRRLQYLILSQNKLSGSIPKKIFEISDSALYFSLAQNSLSGSLPVEFGKLRMVRVIDISGNNLSGEIPASLGDCSNLNLLAMASNEFEGPIPNSIAKIMALEFLDLSSNHLSGQIPIDFGKLKSLKKLNLSFNDLRGLVPSEGVFMNLDLTSLQGNNQLCSDGKSLRAQNLRLPNCSNSTGSNKSSSLVLKIAIAIALLFCVVLCISCAILYQRRKHNVIDKGPTFSPFKGKYMKISYGEILSATNGFNPMNFIGKGGFGSVYKGIIYDKNEDRTGEGNSIVVAVKVIDLKQSKASMSFEVECETLKNIRHRNLVKVITSCSSIDHSGAEFKALVMDYMPNGSLDKCLYQETEAGLNLSLIQRLNIAIDVAMAMDYLHHDCSPPIAHCDLKPSNVLLDNEMTAHVADFGLARLLSQKPVDCHSRTIGLKGSIGYIPPEYGLGGKASTSGDVYSYGILLLEMFTGKKPTDDMFKDGLNLSKFATAVFESQISQIVDQKVLQENQETENISSTSIGIGNTSLSFWTSLHSNNTIESTWQYRKQRCVEAIIRVGLSCAVEAPGERVNMREALTKLQGIKNKFLQLR